jgi:hypothetical protein
MYAFDNTISLEHEKASAIPDIYDSAIVSRPVDDDFCEPKTRQKLAQQSIFAKIA